MYKLLRRTHIDVAIFWTPKAMISSKTTINIFTFNSSFNNKQNIKCNLKSVFLSPLFPLSTIVSCNFVSRKERKKKLRIFSRQQSQINEEKKKRKASYLTTTKKNTEFN